jgi:hypothetical protein
MSRLSAYDQRAITTKGRILHTHGTVSAFLEEQTGSVTDVHGTPLFSESPNALWLYGRQAFPGSRGSWSVESKNFACGRDCGERVLVAKDTCSHNGSRRLGWAIGQEVQWRTCRGGKRYTVMNVIEEENSFLRHEDTCHRSVLSEEVKTVFF